jgi:hypothetical protein
MVGTLQRSGSTAIPAQNYHHGGGGRTASGGLIPSSKTGPFPTDFN